jgi:GH35 family endo-1,4-beta-xylanase
MPLHVIPGQLGMATPFEEILGHSDAEMNAELADYAKLGVHWVRTDFRWNQIQPDADDSYNWSQFDKFVAAADSYGIKVVGLLHDAPGWVNENGGMQSAANATAYANFAKAAAEHFKGKVQHWEIWNEQNLSGPWSPPDAASYTRTLKAAYTAIKSVDPNSFVITGGLSPAPETSGDHVSAVQFLEEMYANGAKDYFDAVGYHPYSWPLQPDNPASWNGWKMMRLGIRETMVDNGDGAKQVWLTEMGAPTKGGKNAVSELAHAQMLQKAADLAHSYSWAGPLMWYSYQDRGGDSADSENWFGLLRPDGEHKPAYTTYQKIAKHETATPTLTPIPLRKPGFTPIGYTGEQSIHGIYSIDKEKAINGGNDSNKLWGSSGKDIFEFIGPKWIMKGSHLVPYLEKSAVATCVQGIANGDGRYDSSIAANSFYDLGL